MCVNISTKLHIKDLIDLMLVVMITRKGIWDTTSTKTFHPAI